MEIYEFNEMKDGWFVGDFNPTSFKTKDFEVCYKHHKKGEEWDKHYHEKSIEINLLISGSMKINNTLIKEGQIFVIKPFYVVKPTFLEDCILVIIKTPSEPKDKIII
jgi:mannose-6-phosphate isomerase-like protein (cupin superfamily)